jgi:transcriptional regulator with XRE-family HTH domain
MFTPLELIPIRLRLLRARHGLSQAQVADRLAMTQQAYAKLERPGANLQLKTIQQVESALNEELLQLA